MDSKNGKLLPSFNAAICLYKTSKFDRLIFEKAGFPPFHFGLSHLIIAGWLNTARAHGVQLLLAMASNLNSGVISETCGDLPTSKDSAVDKTANRKGFEDTVSGMNCSSQRELNRSKDAVNLASGFSSDTSHSPAAGARCAEESMKECYSDVHRLTHQNFLHIFFVHETALTPS